MKLPLRSAQWSVVDKDASPVEREAGDFIREVFFRDLRFTECFGMHC